MAAPTLSGRSPPATISRRGSITPSAKRQSNSSPLPGVGAVDQQELGAVLLEPLDIAVAGRKGLDRPSDPAGDPLGVGDRLDAMELHRPQSDQIGDLDDPPGGLVTEHARRSPSRAEGA